MHTVLGATGVIGRELARALAGVPGGVRLVSRHPKRVNAGDELVAADLLDAGATARAVAGSTVVYLVAGLQYSTAVWQDQWPKIMRNTIGACRRAGCKLVFFDNVYAYGRVSGPMTEDTPFDPCSRKGEVRARIATLLLDTMSIGEIDAMIVRAADFYGPGALLSLPHATVFSRLAAGKTPQWVGNAKAVHTFTYTPDAARAVAVLGQAAQAFGQTWHLPTSADAMTGEGFVRLACELAKRPAKLQVAPTWLLAALGLFNPVLRENNEMMYQFESDYRFDSTKVKNAFGLEATPYRDGIAATLAA